MTKKINMNKQRIENMAIFTNDLIRYSRASKAYAESVFLSLTDKASENPKKAAFDFLIYFVALGDAKPVNPDKAIEIHLSKMKETSDGARLADSEETPDFYDLEVIEYGGLTEPHDVLESVENILNFDLAKNLLEFFARKYPSNIDACIIEG